MGIFIGRSRSRTGQKKNMARRPRGHEKIDMEKRRFRYFPQQFTWRGRRYRVQAVERSWTVSRKRMGNKVERHCFRVRCSAVKNNGSGSARAILEGTFDLYQDLDTSNWHLEKVVSRA